MIRPPPGEGGMVLEDGAADWMTEMHRAELEGWRMDLWGFR